MRLLWILAKYSPGFFVLIAVLSVLSGACNAALLGLISAELSGEEIWFPSTGWNFLGLVLLVLVSGYAARVAVLTLASRSTYDLRMNLCRQILDLPLRDFEKIGESQVLAVLTQDIGIIGSTLLKVPELMVAVSILAGCAVYLLILSPLTVVSLTAFVVLLYFTYKIPMKTAKKILGRARETWDQLMGCFKTISAGFKELKLHAGRRHSFISQDLRDSADCYRRTMFLGQHVTAVAKSWGKTTYLIFVGFVLYGISMFLDIELSVLTAFTLTLLYMRDSVTKILDVIPHLTEAGVAMKKIESYDLSLASFKRGFELSPVPFAAQKALGTGATNGFQGLQLSGVSHRYYHEGQDEDFVLGPIDLEVKPGELVFVIGGNGSGKTTLAKLLVGLYVPEQGKIQFNGRIVDDKSREEYRRLFTATFTDFYIFDRLVGLDAPDLEQRCRHFLTKLQLDHKVEIRDGWFSTTELSQGQRKRLVLLTAYLENRPVYVFDEWAADQDPTFKQFFYLELLPEMKKNGKTIIVISHDDRYYHVGDRLVKLEDGELVSDTSVSEALPAPVSAFGPLALADPSAATSAPA